MKIDLICLDQFDKLKDNLKSCKKKKTQFNKKKIQNDIFKKILKQKHIGLIWINPD